MNPTTLLHRIIKSGWWLQADTVSSQAFRPTLGADKLLSVYDGDQIAADAAYKHYANDPGKPLPTGVLAITVAEYSTEDWSVIPDPDSFPEHVLIDFREFGTNQIKRKSETLRNAAIARGWLLRQ